MIGFTIYVKLSLFALLWSSALSYRKLSFAYNAFAKLITKSLCIEPALANKGKGLMNLR